MRNAQVAQRKRQPCTVCGWFTGGIPPGRRRPQPDRQDLVTPLISTTDTVLSLPRVRLNPAFYVGTR